METIKVRGLARLAGWMFGAWGVVAAVRGLWDLGWGVPESNHYAPQPWGFVSEQAWRRYASFELVYGLACLGVAWFLFRCASRLPETVKRKRREEELRLL